MRVYLILFYVPFHFSFNFQQTDASAPGSPADAQLEPTSAPPYGATVLALPCWRVPDRRWPWEGAAGLVRERRLAKFRQNVARFRLYRLRFLQVNMRFAAFFKIYQIFKLKFLKFGNILQILRHLRNFC